MPGCDIVTFGGTVSSAVQASVKKIVDNAKPIGPVPSVVSVDNSLMGTSIVEVKLNNVTDPQNYNVTIKGQVANYYASTQTFKIASSTHLELANVDVTKDVTVTHK